MKKAARKHFPCPTPETQPYWDGCRRHELRLQQCDRCGEVQFYPRIVCRQCLSPDLSWITASGAGRIRTFTAIRHPVSEAYAADIPYVVALIELDEGPTMMSNVVECAPESLEIGTPVQVLFEDWDEEITIPKFRPVIRRI